MECENAIPNDTGYICSECNTGFPCGLRYQCSSCIKYFNCPACYSLLSGFQPESTSIRHPHSHKLIASENEYDWKCSDCKIRFKSGPCMWCPSIFCFRKKYCLKCYQAKTNWMPPKGYLAPNIRLHPHTLVLSHVPQYTHSLYTCHKCVEVFNGSGYHCETCQYDLCPVCYNTELNRISTNIDIQIAFPTISFQYLKLSPRCA